MTAGNDDFEASMSFASGTLRNPNYGTQTNRVSVEDYFNSQQPLGRQVPHFMTFFQRLDRWAKLFVVFFTMEAVAVMAMCAYRLRYSLPLTESTRLDVVYTLALALNIPFCLYYAVHGTLRERHVELYAFVCATLLVTCYVCYQYFVQLHSDTADETERQNRFVQMVLGCVCEPINLLLALIVASHFGWVSFMTVGGDLVLLGLWHTYTMFASFSNVNLEVFLTFMLIAFGSQPEIFPYEWIVEVSVLGVSLANFALAKYMFTREEGGWMALYMVSLLVQPAYLAWKGAELVFLYPEQFAAVTRLSVFVVGGTSLLLVSLTALYAVLTFKNFGKGLYDRLH